MLDIVLKKVIGDGLGIHTAIVEVNGKRYKRRVFNLRGDRYIVQKVGIHKAMIYLKDIYNYDLKENWNIDYTSEVRI